MTLNAPYAATELLLDREFFEMLKGKKVFCGMKNTLLKAGDYFKELTLLDYSKREEFAVRNAVLRRRARWRSPWENTTA